MMNRSNTLVAAGLGSALALAVATPSFADAGNVGAAIGGFAAGALVGSAAANAYHGPSYAYQPGYAYGSYAYVPAPSYPYFGDFPVDSNDTGGPIYRSQLGPNCTIGLKQQDRC
jgi:hypothetical protein